MATLCEVARRAGVSTTTASRVLNRDQTLVVREETRQAVQQAARDLQYRPPRQRREERGPLVIGVADWRILGGHSNVELTALAACAASLAPEIPMEFLHLASSGDMLNLQTDGIIALGDMTGEETEWVCTHCPNLVFVNSDRNDFLYDRITVELDPALNELFEDLAPDCGYETMGYIGGLVYLKDGLCIGQRRSDSLVQALQRRGFYHPEWVSMGEMTPESGYVQMQAMAQAGPLPRLLLLGSDQLAVGVMCALRELHISVPDQMALVVYQDIETTDLGQAFTQIRMYPDFLWTTALRTLVDRILYHRTEVTKVLIPARLIRGNTTGMELK